MNGKGHAAVFTCSSRQLVHIMLITGWQVDLFNEPKKDLFSCSTVMVFVMLHDDVSSLCSKAAPD